MTLFSWLPIFMVALTSFVLIVLMTRLYYSRRFGTPMPSCWRGLTIHMLGMLIHNGRLLLGDHIPPMWGNVIAMPLMILGGVTTLVERRQEKKLSSEPEPPRPNEPERIPIR